MVLQHSEKAHALANPGPLMLDLEGLTLTSEERQQLANPLVGGVILFTRNFCSTDQLVELIGEIRRVSPGLIIAVDHEGGRVQRFREGFTVLPPMAKIGHLLQDDPARAKQLAQDCGWLMAAELIAYDIDLSFAPVLDQDYGRSAVIGDRAFADNPEDIICLAECFITGMHEAGMAATGKHFPGHGWVVADSHHEIPVDPRSLAELADSDLRIFSAIVRSGIDALMPAHVIYPDVDSQPAGFSPRWLQQILRQDLAFNGVIFSDDLGMAGATVAGGFPERAAAALSAGCDMILVCNQPAGAREVLAYLETQQIGPNARLSAMRLNRTKQFSPEQLIGQGRWHEIREQLGKLSAKNIGIESQ